MSEPKTNKTNRYHKNSQKVWFTYRCFQTTAAQEYESFLPRTELSSPGVAVCWNLSELNKQEMDLVSVSEKFRTGVQ